MPSIFSPSFLFASLYILTLMFRWIKLQQIDRMSFFQRLGTDRHKFKVQFVMRKLKFSRHLPGKIYLSIRRGDHKMKTGNLIEMDMNHQCDLKKQVVIFPSITLFYDKSTEKYQPKPGDIKILLLNDAGDKKLLGSVPFDIAEFANQKLGTGFNSNQTQSKAKIKRRVQEMPQKLKVEASLQFQVFTKYIGEASQTDKSIKNDNANVRSQSPFDKLKNFFFGENQEEKIKAPQSPKKVVKPQMKQSKIQSKQRPKSRQRKQKEKQQIDFQFQEEELPKKPTVKHRTSSENNVLKPIERQKAKKRRQQQKQKDIQEQSIQSSKRQPKTKQKGSTRKRTPSPQISEELDFQQQKPKIRKQQQQISKTSNKVTKNNQQNDEINKSTKSKNIVQQKQRDTLTQYQQKNRKASNYNKSQQPTSHNQKSQNQQFYFDDPSSFPPHLRPNYKKDKNNNGKIEDTSSPQITKKTKQNEKKNKTDRQIEKHSNSQDEQDQFFDQAPSKNTLSVPSPSRKVKQNSIPISSKELQKQQQKKKRQQRGSNKDVNEIPFIPKNNDKAKAQKPKQPKEGKLTQNPPSKDNKAQKQQELNSSQVKNLFTSFDQPKKQQKPLVITAKKQKQNESNIFMKEQLQKKSKEWMQMKAKVQSLQGIQKRLKQEQQLREKAQKAVAHQKQLNRRLQKELQRVKQQNNGLREQESQSSIFRATQDHFMHNSVQNDLQQQNKQLQKQKNELIVNMTKQKQKHAKEIKILKEELQKQRLKFKQFENTSKIDLKKLKDDNLKLSGNVEIMKDKNKQKIRENETLLAQNKNLNSEVIELKDKLASLKLKICEKLNEANQHGQSQLMQVLTELCEDM